MLCCIIIAENFALYVHMEHTLPIMVFVKKKKQFCFVTSLLNEVILVLLVNCSNPSGGLGSFMSVRVILFP